MGVHDGSSGGVSKIDNLSGGADKGSGRGPSTEVEVVRMSLGMPGGCTVALYGSQGSLLGSFPIEGDRNFRRLTFEDPFAINLSLAGDG